MKGCVWDLERGKWVCIAGVSGSSEESRWEIPFYLGEWLKNPRWLIPKVAQPQVPLSKKKSEMY
jgi:hypothetical protein